MNEQTAIQLCLRRQDPNGFEYLVDRYKREAFFHAHALLNNEADAADACQEAFLRAFAAMPRLPALDRFYPWFYRILRNRCLNMLDRRRTRERHAARERADEARRVDESTPARILADNEDAQAVWKTLCRLSEPHRVILTLKYVNGFSYDEIARALGVPRGTVMSRLYAARQAFRAAHPPIRQTSPPKT